MDKVEHGIENETIVDQNNKETRKCRIEIEDGIVSEDRSLIEATANTYIAYHQAAASQSHQRLLCLLTLDTNITRRISLRTQLRSLKK